MNDLVENKCSGSGSSLEIVNIAETPYTLKASDSGKKLNINADQVIIPLGLPIGFNVIIVQVHASQQILFSPAVGVTMNEADGNSKTAKQWANVSLVCDALNVYNLSGYTGT